MLLNFNEAGVSNLLTGDAAEEQPKLLYTGSVIPPSINVGSTSVQQIYIGSDLYWPVNFENAGSTVTGFTSNNASYSLDPGNYGVVLIGAGGAGSNPGSGGGGGGGAVVYATFTVSSATTMNVVIGTEGIIEYNQSSPSSNGASTSVTIDGNTVTANGGLSASSSTGGSGGGYSADPYFTVVFGSNGGNGGNGDPSWGTGGGGGAGGADGGTTIQGPNGVGGSFGNTSPEAAGGAPGAEKSRSDWDGSSGGGGGYGPFAGGGAGGMGTVGTSSGASGGGAGTGFVAGVPVGGVSGPPGKDDGPYGENGKQDTKEFWYGGGGGGGRANYGAAGNGAPGFIGLLKL